MNTFTELYLTGLQRGMANQTAMAKQAADLMAMVKQAGGIMDYQPLAPENNTASGAAIGGLGGAALGGVSNALLGSSRRDPRTGEKQNGIVSRLLKGGLMGGIAGAAGGAVLGGDVMDGVRGHVIDQAGEAEGRAAQNMSVSQLLRHAQGQGLGFREGAKVVGNTAMDEVGKFFGGGATPTTPE